MKDEWCGQNMLVKFNPISTDCNPTSTEHYEGFRCRWHDQRAIASLFSRIYFGRLYSPLCSGKIPTQSGKIEISYAIANPA